jgi:DNA-binding CsgD family transcriptional regulator
MMYERFIKQYIGGGFLNISRQDPFLIEMEKQLEHNKQFFYVADLLRLKIHFVSNGSKKLIGVNPEDFDLSTFISRTHPDDQERYSLARTKYVKLGHDLFIRKKGISILSTYVRQLNPDGNYFNLLFQGYMFYSEIPFKTVYTILLLTDLSGFKLGKHGYHYYAGDDPKFFRYPDMALLKTGNIFSGREIDILRLIAAGLDSEKIASKLSLSINTVNTHRRNMLKKTNKSTTHDLVIELQERGIL